MKSYQYFLKKIGEYGTVREVNFPIAKIVGLPHVKTQELVMFEANQLGEVFSYDSDEVDVLLYSDTAVKVNMQVVRTDQYVTVPVGKELLGQIIDPLGHSFFQEEEDDSKFDDLDRVGVEVSAKGIADRRRIERPFLTGTSLVDLLLPLGRGQRQLIIGDRKTGKSSFLLSTVKNQIDEGSLVVYAAIGKKKSDIKKLDEFFQKEKLSGSSVIVASDPLDSPSLIFLTAYTAMSIAEYFRDKGSDVLIVFDDLSTHAKFYREMSLLAGRFPGRDSYPGDIFFIHARLLERAGNFKHKDKKEVAITALPVVETIEGDLTGFISTNVMGMTDGHIFFDSDAYYKGRRPAINIGLSVTRVGRQTQTSLKRQINSEVTAFLANYERLQTFSHFGAELSEKVKTILKTGDRLQAFFDQHYKIIVPEAVQLILLSLIWLHALDDLSVDQIVLLRDKLILRYSDSSLSKEMEEIIRSENFHELLIKTAKKKDEFVSLIH